MYTYGHKHYFTYSNVVTYKRRVNWVIFPCTRCTFCKHYALYYVYTFKCTKQTLKLKGKWAFYILFFFFYVCIFSLIVSMNVSIKGSLTLFSVSRVVLSTYLHFGLLVFAYLSFIMMSRESLQWNVHYNYMLFTRWYVLPKFPGTFRDETGEKCM